MMIPLASQILAGETLPAGESSPAISLLSSRISASRERWSFGFKFAEASGWPMPRRAQSARVWPVEFTSVARRHRQFIIGSKNNGLVELDKRLTGSRVVQRVKDSREGGANFGVRRFGYRLRFGKIYLLRARRNGGAKFNQRLSQRWRQLVGRVLFN